ncbi:MAG: hypothetical protein WDA11_14070 [Thiohalomonadaceae bacterium]
MSIPLRISDNLVRLAEAEGRIEKRSATRQVEFWAELGRHVAAFLSTADQTAIVQGIAKLRIELPSAGPIDVDEVIAAVNADTRPGTQAAVYYEASRNCPGLVDQVAHGERTPGTFRNGEFVPAKLAQGCS